MADSKSLKPIPTAVMLRARSEFSEVAQLKGDRDFIDRVELSDLFTSLGLPKEAADDSLMDAYFKEMDKDRFGVVCFRDMLTFLMSHADVADAIAASFARTPQKVAPKKDEVAEKPKAKVEAANAKAAEVEAAEAKAAEAKAAEARAAEAKAAEAKAAEGKAAKDEAKRKAEEERAQIAAKAAAAAAKAAEDEAKRKAEEERAQIAAKAAAAAAKARAAAEAEQKEKDAIAEEASSERKQRMADPSNAPQDSSRRLSIDASIKEKADALNAKVMAKASADEREALAARRPPVMQAVRGAFQGGSGSDVAREMRVPSFQNLSEALGEKSSSWWLGLGLTGAAVAFTVARSLGRTSLDS